ncbi:phage holin family protein [Cellulomonas sp. PhB143]|uniref:phage holin family protein n=1 Tax=Cellulomonas sp. PhB143 TaxID=2485186 RepID=UPI000F493E86|nr:phage holin family protein [Cellulomonas sp. PhB143]ROS76535.1 putative superfamily III holin-X [Cellulomonas sp. PhB143]
MSDWDDGREPPKPSIGKLVERLSEQATRLVRAEIELAKTELKTKVAHAGIGIGLFVVAGVLALYGLGWLFYAAFEGIAVALAPWLSALLLGVAILVVVAVLALVGKSQLQRGMPPTPEKAIKSVKEDVAALKGGATDQPKSGDVR